jgi:hypothetical protein
MQLVVAYCVYTGGAIYTVQSNYSVVLYYILDMERRISNV